MKAALRAVKNAGYDDIEVKVREATSSDRWGVTDSQMAEIARATEDYNAYPKLFAILWKRLTDVEHVMHVQKALILTEYLLRYGSDRFIQDARRRSRDVSALQKYKHYDEHNQDDAKDARAKAKIVTDLLENEQRLNEERVKAAKLRENTRGIGSNVNQYAGSSNGGGRYGGGGNGSYGNSYDNGQSNYGNDTFSSKTYESHEYGRDQPAQRSQRTSIDDNSDPYGERSQPKSAVPPSSNADEEAEAERKRKKKEKKKREAEEAARQAAASSTTSSAPRRAAPADDPDDPFNVPVIPAALSGNGNGNGNSNNTSPPAEQEKRKKPKKDKKAEKSAGNDDPFSQPSASSQYAAVAQQQQQQQQRQQQQQHHASLQMPQDHQRKKSYEVDLTAFGEQGANGNRTPSTHDFLSGSPQHRPGDDDLSDFANLTTHDQPTLWDTHASSGSLDFTETTTQAAPQPAAPKKSGDIWASDLFNLEKLDQNPVQPKKVGVTDGVSMSMMKGINPNLAPTPRKNGGGSFGQPAAAAAGPPQAQQPFIGVQNGGYAAPYQQPPQLGPQYGAPMNAYGMAQGYPAQGYPQQYPPQGYPPQGYAPQGYPPQGYGMPQGYPQQYPPQGYPQQPYGGMQQRPPQQQPATLDPFASLAPTKSNTGKPVDFFVPAAKK